MLLAAALKRKRRRLRTFNESEKEGKKKGAIQ
jgi:hypothetical protein